MSFTTDLTRFAQKALRRHTQVLRSVALSADSSAILISPVDTGRFRANWNAALNSADGSTTERTDPGGQDALARGAGVIARAGGGDTIILSNNLPYARRLNNGWSQQAPAGILPIIENQFQTFVAHGVRVAVQEHP
jgi:hypothetical protein